MDSQILIAGFGGQGVLFAGKFLATKGLLEERQVSWLPSYGPEMRGGTANCSIILSDSPIGSPIVTKPDILLAMNLPSLDKYENDVVENGSIVIDSSLIGRKIERKDVKAYYIPATRIASDEGIPTLANMIMLGKMIKETGVVDYSTILDAIKNVISAKHKDMLEVNLKALDLGYNYKD